MNIALVDVDGHSGFPNLALMRLSAWHKAQGDSVEWWNGFTHYDRVYLSKVFTFTPDFTTVINADEIITGGTGYKDYTSLPPEVEAIPPDYSIYPHYKRAVGFLTRGCIRGCPWCIVPRKEGDIHPAATWEQVSARTAGKSSFWTTMCWPPGMAWSRSGAWAASRYGWTLTRVWMPAGSTSVPSITHAPGKTITMQGGEHEMAGKRTKKALAEDSRYHDTWRLLKKYRDVVWSMELSVQQVKKEFEIEFGSTIDDFLESVYLAGADLGGTRIENHARCIERSNQMLKLLNNAVEVLRTRHKSGETYYWLLYYTFLSPQQLDNVNEIIEQLRPHIRDIGRTTYYRKREQAVEALSSILWGYSSKDCLALLADFFPDSEAEI